MHALAAAGEGFEARRARGARPPQGDQPAARASTQTLSRDEGGDGGVADGPADAKIVRR